jgi:succinate dehydrogenase/fumarate reductase flavoprotein subunit
VVDWSLRTNLDGLFAAGQQLFGSEDHANAATSGRYAGRVAAEYAQGAAEPRVAERQIRDEVGRVYAPVRRTKGIEWKELTFGICRIMQDYCGPHKNDELLRAGLRWFDELAEAEASELCARNPHELMRSQETMSALTCGRMILVASLAR